MEANELRIGNYYDCNGEVKQATPSTIEDVWHGERVWVRPIPLTEEWIVRFGFVQENGMMSYVLPEYEDIKITHETVASYFRLYPYTYKIEFVHQLQNLYFALTGEELKFT